MRRRRVLGLLVAVAHDALFVALPVAVFLDGALVVFLLAAREPDLALGAVLLPVERERHERVALALDGADETVDLVAVEQQLSRAARIGDDVRRRRQERRDLRAEQEDLAVLDDRVGLGELHASLAQALDLPAFEHDAALEALVDVVLVPGALVERDRAAGVVLFLLGFVHLARILADYRAGDERRA